MTTDSKTTATTATATTTHQDDTDLDEILRVAQGVAVLAGREIRLSMTTRTAAADGDCGDGGDGGTRAGVAMVTTMTKSDRTTDLVTETDRRVEEMIIRNIRQRYPTHRIIGEETNYTDDDDNNHHHHDDDGGDGDGNRYGLKDSPTWTIDPIDGTTNFVHGLSLTAVLIGFVVDRRPTVGVIYDPMADEMFYAVRGRGAYLQRRAASIGPSTNILRDDTTPATVSATTATNSSPPPPRERLHVSNTTSLERAVISMDAGYGRTEAAVDRYITVQRALLLQRIRHVRVFGCCGLTMAYVAAGRLDACFEEGSWIDDTGPKIWDLAPGTLIVREAGGITRDVSHRKSKGEPLEIMQRSLFAAATTELADALVETIYNCKA